MQGERLGDLPQEQYHDHGVFRSCQTTPVSSSGQSCEIVEYHPVTVVHVGPILFFTGAAYKPILNTNIGLSSHQKNKVAPMAVIGMPGEQCRT